MMLGTVHAAEANGLPFLICLEALLLFVFHLLLAWAVYWVLLRIASMYGIVFLSVLVSIVISPSNDDPT